VTLIGLVKLPPHCTLELFLKGHIKGGTQREKIYESFIGNHETLPEMLNHAWIMSSQVLKNCKHFNFNIDRVRLTFWGRKVGWHGMHNYDQSFRPFVAH
jgi:hypothetical protein